MRRLRRASLPVCIMALAFGGSASPTPAQDVARHDSSAPVDYAADRIEVLDKAQRVMLSGNVDITQKDLRLRAARTIVSYTGGNGNYGDVKIDRIVATGNVEILRGDEKVWGDVAVYDFARRVITVAGNVRLQNARANGTGGRLVIDLDQHTSQFVGQSSAEGAAGGRVKGTFNVKKKD
ncbi:OstA family protein [Novosphingobium sp. FSY-8]|uniref:OstA family protein n=2 Tax=Novosphingobium ovatum TaxID=1908523 RepID=A0ABW9XGI0_9SPHN|nr:OstA family protein [Novosphingobium ovatum]